MDATRWVDEDAGRRRATRRAALGATLVVAAGLASLGGCAKPEPPIRISYVPEAPCVEYARGRCSAKPPRVPPKPAYYEKLLPPYDGFGFGLPSLF